MYEDLKGKKALITGAGKKTGIGYACAEKLASLGTDLVLADLGGKTVLNDAVRSGTEQDLDAIAAELNQRFGVRVVPVLVDVTDGASVAAMVERIREDFTHLDILCNNAGATFGVPNTVAGYDEKAWIRTVDVNLFGTFRVSRAVLPLMAGRAGVIVNTASRAGKVPPLFNSAYAVAKAGVIMLTKTMAREMGGAGIRVNAICPGQIKTDLTEWRFDMEAQIFSTSAEDRKQEMSKTIPLGYIGEPGDVAGLVVFLVSNESRYLTGQAVNVDGGQCMEL